MAPYPVVFPAVLLATLAGGFGAGMVAAIFGLGAADYLFVPPRFTLSPANLTHGLNLLVTALALIVVLWLAERYRNIMASRAYERVELMRAQLQLYEQSHAFMFVLRGAEYRYEYANPSYLRFVGREKDDVLGKTLLEVVPNIEPIYLHLLAKVRQTGEAFVGRNVPRPVQSGGVTRNLYIDFVYQPMRNEDGAVDAIFVEGYEVTDKVETEQRLQFLLREVDHRANNLLAVVQSIIKLTKADSVDALKHAELGRIGALARAHQLLSESRWRGADLETLVGEELRPYTLGDEARARAQGPSMSLSAPEAEALAMAIHELATNAAKYGAFSAPAGRVEVAWGRDSSGARHIRWQEGGGPPVAGPDHQGLGTQLLERALAASGGRTQLFWHPEGLVCEFDLPPEDQQEPRGSIDEAMGATLAAEAAPTLNGSTG
jgi:two-component sensor histidine kinase